MTINIDNCAIFNNGCNDKTFEGFGDRTQLIISNSFIDHCNVHGGIYHHESNITASYFEYQLSIKDAEFLNINLSPEINVYSVKLLRKR